ncbi:MAG: ferric reductase-like transmembrane domain-containing protein [Dermatophilaceae bacterium]
MRSPSAVAPLPHARVLPGHLARPKAAPRWSRQTLSALPWVLLAVVAGLWASNGGIPLLRTPAGALTSTGRLCGLFASCLMLVQVLLMARVPPIERAFGQDELVRRHRLVGFTSFSLLWAHIVLVWLGYAATAQHEVWGTLADLVLEYPGILLALGGTLALCLVVVTSMRAARGRLRYESWHLLHLYAYLGVGLALPHQLWNGQEFVGNLAATVFWWVLWSAAVMAILVWRVGMPAYRTLRHRLRVIEVYPEAPGVTTVVMAGRQLARLPVAAGQFFQWRFLGSPGRSRAHPYSLSEAPDGHTLRITAAHLGDGSSALADLKVGSRVALEGPYGRLHAGARTRQKVALLACGIGVTPIRALLEDLPQRPGDVTLVYRARSSTEVLFADELAALAAARGARILTVLGPRVAARPSWLPQSAAHLSDAAALAHLVPDIAEHDVFICGNPQWTALVADAARANGTPDAHLHIERFAY